MENVKGIFEGTSPIREGTTAIGLGLCLALDDKFQVSDFEIQDDKLSDFEIQDKFQVSDFEIQYDKLSDMSDFEIQNKFHKLL
jgi:hypothetical protein